MDEMDYRKWLSRRLGEPPAAPPEAFSRIARELQAREQEHARAVWWHQRLGVPASLMVSALSLFILFRAIQSDRSLSPRIESPFQFTQIADTTYGPMEDLLKAVGNG